MIDSMSVSMTSSKGSTPSLVPSASSLYGRRKLKEEAEGELFKKRTESDALEYLYRAKPAYLVQDGSEVWVETRDVEAKMDGIILRLKVHSFPERAQRLQYLLGVLKQKWINKPETYKGMLTLLTELYDQPTKNLHLVVSTTQYSTSVEEDVGDTVLFGEDLRQAELQKEKYRQEVVAELLGGRQEVHYSSDDEMSEWSLSSSSGDEEELPLEVRRPSISSMSAIPSAEPQPSKAEMKERAEIFWSSERDRGNLELESNLLRVTGVSLTEQPVISSLTALYTRFGEHWEWKKASSQNQRLTTTFLEESDIIQELLWQFVSPSATHSPMFGPDWTLRPQITIRSVSNSALQSVLTEMGKVLKKLEGLKEFIKRCNTTEHSFPPIYHTYAHALSKVLTFVTYQLNEIERNLKRDEMNCNRKATTLVQLHTILRPMMKIIVTLDHSYGQCLNFQPSTPNWLKSLRLITSLEQELNLIPDPAVYGLSLYIFSQCLISFLDFVLRPLEMKQWSETEFLMKRNPEVKISDGNFWTEVVKVQEKLPGLPSFLEWMLPKVVVMLKVEEIVRQLSSESDFGLRTPPLPKYKTVVQDFLEELLGKRVGSDEDEEGFEAEEVLAGHLTYLGLDDCVMLGGLDWIREQKPDCFKMKSPFDEWCTELDWFWKLDEVPMVQSQQVLLRVLRNHLGTYFSVGEHSLADLFSKYDLLRGVDLLHEIVFGGQEDFAITCCRLGYQTRILEQMGEQDRHGSPNDQFQAILNHFYPEDRNGFEIEFVPEPKSNTASFGLKIEPKFPLTLVVTPKTLVRYEFVAREIFRIRKGLWILNRLQMKECHGATLAETKPLFLLRFSMIHFWMSLRSFVLLSIFNSNEPAGRGLDHKSDVNEMLKAFEDSSSNWALYKILSSKIMGSMIIKPVLHTSLVLGKKWKTGITLMELTILGVRVRRAWELILELGSSRYSPEMNQIAHFFGPIPDGIF